MFDDFLKGLLRAAPNEPKNSASIDKRCIEKVTECLPRTRKLHFAKTRKPAESQRAKCITS